MPVGVKIGTDRVKNATVACRLPKFLPIGSYHVVFDMNEGMIVSFKLQQLKYD